MSVVLTVRDVLVTLARDLRDFVLLINDYRTIGRKHP